MKLKLHWQIFIALILGCLVGVLLPQSAPYISWAGDMFLNALSMIVVPLIFCSIVTSLGDIQDSTFNLKRVGTRTILYYLFTMSLAIITGWILVHIIEPGKGIQIAQSLEEVPKLEETSIISIIVNLIPKNMFQAFATNNTLPVILIALLIGIFLPKVSENNRSTLINLFKGGQELMIMITHFVIRFSPIGVFAILVKQFSQASDFWSLIQTMMLYVLTVALGLLIHMFITMPLVLRFGFKVNPWKHLSNMSTPLITGFSTASSGAALPLTLHAVEKKDGVSKEITNFTIPLGAAINMDGTALLECVAVLFIAQAYGVDLSITQQIIVVITALLSAVGTAGIPMAGLVMMTIVLNAVGLPLEGIGLIVGVDRILDMMRTSTNIYGDTCVAVMVAKSEKEKLSIDIHR